MKTSTAESTPGEIDTGRVLAVHASPRVRGAIHRSLSPFDEFSISLAASLDEAKAMYSRDAPTVVLLRLSEGTVAWCQELRADAVALVFCYSRGDEMSLCAKARALGMKHFVELPGDMPASWARQASRLSSTVQRAIAERRSRDKLFTRSTMILAAAPLDLAQSRSEGACPDPVEVAREARHARQRRPTLVGIVNEADTDKVRREERL